MSSPLIQVLGVVLLLILGYLFGRVAEQRHYKRIIKREAEMQHLPVVATRYPPLDREYAKQLVTGNVVIASDYFKTFLANLINIFGGRVTPFETMLDRARRESILRMKDEANQMNAAYVFNVKFDTTRIATGKVAAMEVVAYGTAMIPIEMSENIASAEFEPGRSIHGIS
jgi:uncharacterized protein YbjQ (UPF0145 family)